jgi:hypothetical protein
MTKRAIFVAALVCSVAIYEFPCLLTLLKTGWSPLPPVVDYPADQMLYLNLSAIHHASATELVNPWYGEAVRTVDVPHLRFPLTFFLIHLTHSLFGSWTTAMLVWTAIWAALTFAAAAFCLDSFLPDKDRWLIVTGAFALLVLQSPLTYVAEIMKLPSGKGFFELWLPFVRFAYPQVVVPIALAYWGLLARVLKSTSLSGLAAMALLQLLACATFPYIVPVIAVGTGITILIAKRRNSQIALSWRAIFLFVLGCGVLDIGYLVLAGLAQSHGNLQFALRFRPEIIIASARFYVLLLVIASALAQFARASLAARATVTGLALSNALLAFYDVIFPNPTTLMRTHVNYLLALTTWLPLLVFGLPFLEQLNSRFLRSMLMSALVLLGLWEGYASYRLNLPVNLFQAAAVDELQQLRLSAKDLVIAPAQMSDDLSCSVPLMSPARVLFTRDAENVLPLDRIRGELNFRQALYLEMRGINHASFLSLTDPATPLFRLGPIAQFAELALMSSPLKADNLRAQRLIRERLAPVLAQLEADPAQARSLLAGVDRIIVIDDGHQPLFDPAPFSRWLQIEESYESRGTRVWICRSRFRS